MGYQEEDMQAIRPANLHDLPATEPQMRSFGLTILAPMFAIAALGLMTLVPGPKDIYLALKPVGTPLTDVAAGDRNGRETFVSIASRIKELSGDNTGPNADCFDDLSLAAPGKLDRCGRAVYEALAEVEKNPSLFAQDTASPLDRRQLVQELKLAATEVCRERWTRSGVLAKDSPACAVSIAALEPQDE